MTKHFFQKIHGEDITPMLAPGSRVPLPYKSMAKHRPADHWDQCLAVVPSMDGLKGKSCSKPQFLTSLTGWTKWFEFSCKCSCQPIPGIKRYIYIYKNSIPNMCSVTWLMHRKNQLLAPRETRHLACSSLCTMPTNHSFGSTWSFSRVGPQYRCNMMLMRSVNTCVPIKASKHQPCLFVFLNQKELSLSALLGLERGAQFVATFCLWTILLRLNPNDITHGKQHCQESIWYELVWKYSTSKSNG